MASITYQSEGESTEAPPHLDQHVLSATNGATQVPHGANERNHNNNKINNVWYHMYDTASILEQQELV